MDRQYPDRSPYPKFTSTSRVLVTEGKGFYRNMSQIRRETY